MALLCPVQEGSSAFIIAVAHERQGVIQAFVDHGGINFNETNHVGAAVALPPLIARLGWSWRNAYWMILVSDGGPNDASV